MKLVYASRTGNVQKLVGRLGIAATKITDGTETVEGEYVLVTYTDGRGDIPAVVDQFIGANRDGLKAAAVSGNSEKHPDTFAGAAEKLADKYGVKILAKFEKDGDAAAEEAIRAAL